MRASPLRLSEAARARVASPTSVSSKSRVALKIKRLLQFFSVNRRLYRDNRDDQGTTDRWECIPAQHGLRASHGAAETVHSSDENYSSFMIKMVPICNRVHERTSFNILF